jgi:hypothetical protein
MERHLALPSEDLQSTKGTLCCCNKKAKQVLSVMGAQAGAPNPIRGSQEWLPRKGDDFVGKEEA